MNRIRKYISKRDVVLFGLLLALIAGVYALYDLQPGLLQRDTMIDQAYMVKQAEDASLYIVDSGQERLLHLSQDGHMIWYADMPMGNYGTALYVDDISLDGMGNVYVQVSDWDGMHIDRELILVYNQRGRHISTIAEAEYECSAVNKHSRFGLTAENGELKYVQADGDSIRIMGINGEERSYAYADAVVRISDACILPDALLVIDKNGSISKLSGADSNLLYDASYEPGANRVPYRMAADDAGNIYFTDIRNASIQQLMEHPFSSKTVYSDTDTLTVEIGLENELLLAESECVRLPGGELTEWSWGGRIIVERIAALLMALAALLLILHFSAKLIRLLKNVRLTNAQRTSLLLMICVLIAVALVCVKLIDGFRATYRDKVQEELKVTAYMVSSTMNGDDIRHIDSAADFDGEYYGRLVDRMQRAFSGDVEMYSQLYCNILRTDEAGNAWAIAYLDQSIGTYFPLEDYEVEEAQKVIETGNAVWNAESSLTSGVYCYVKVPIYASDSTVAGVVEVGTQTMVLENMIAETIRQILMTMLLLVLIIWLAVSELMAYTGAQEHYREVLERSEKHKSVLPGHLVRLLVFLIFAAYNMSASFLPVYILRTMGDGKFADRELMASLPITLNIFFIGTMALCCAGLLRRTSFRTLSVLSALFSLAANLLIFLMPVYPCILLSLVLDGIGMGFMSNAVYVLLSRIQDEKERLGGFAIYNAACISGINFGMMLGSILAASFSQHMVFACVAVMWLAVVGITVMIGRNIGELLDTGSDQEAANTTLGKFLGSRGVLAFLALIQNPYIVFNSFAYYFVPLYCDEMGCSETTVSILLMIYSLFAVYLSDTITRMADRAAGQFAMYLAFALNICGVILFGQLQTMTAMIAALTLMGIAASFGKSVQQNYFMSMKAVKEYGEDRSIGLYNFTENIGESLGPVVFGKLAVFPSRALAFTGFGGVAAAVSALYFVLFGNRTKREVSYEETLP